MIAIDRGPEPPALAQARARLLARAAVARDAGVSVAQLHLGDYAAGGAVHQQLLARQGGHCAYCECHVIPEALEIEHFRPTGGAWRTPTPRAWRTGKQTKITDASHPDRWDAEGYWWLTWTWENLLLACSGCNRGLKGNHFAVSTGTPTLAPMSFKLEDEKALLIDPTATDPLDLIRWRPALQQDPWTALSWEPAPHKAIASYTIELMKLDMNLATKVTGHIHHNVLREARPFKDQPITDDQVEELRRVLLSPHQPHHGPTWWALIQLLPALKDRLPRPGRLGPRAAASPWPPRPDLAGLPERIQLRVRAQDDKDGPALVVDIRAHRPQATDAELAALLGRKESTIQGWRP